MFKLSGILFQPLSLKKDKNGNDYYLGKLTCSDGSSKVFFFFQPNYDLSLRLSELETKQELTLQGCWGKNQVFLATDFYLEAKLNNNFQAWENYWGGF